LQVPPPDIVSFETIRNCRKTPAAARYERRMRMKTSTDRPAGTMTGTDDMAGIDTDLERINRMPTESSQQDTLTAFTHIRKRDGRIVPFDMDKIRRAMLKAGRATGEFSEDMAGTLSIRVLSITHVVHGSREPSVEQVQDIVIILEFCHQLHIN